MAVEIFTVATRPDPGFTRLQNSVSRMGGAITVLGQGEAGYWGHGWRWKTFIRAARNSQAEVVVHCDGYDTACLQPMTTLNERFAALAHTIVFAYEPSPQPEYYLGLQAGLMIASRESLTAAFDDATLEGLFPDHFNDQFQLQAMYSWNPTLFKLDREMSLFHTLGPGTPPLAERGGRLVNGDTGVTPCFVHAPNQGDLSMVDDWLAAHA